MATKNMHLRLLAAVTITTVICIDAFASDMTADIARCRSEVDDARRLRCYDRVAGLPASVVPNTPAAPSPAMSPAEFGVSNGPIAAQQSRSEASLKEIIAKAVSITKKARGELVVTLDNDQVWQQLQPSSMRIQAGDEVAIKTGALGSYILVTPSGRGTKVQRVK